MGDPAACGYLPYQADPAPAPAPIPRYRTVTRSLTCIVSCFRMREKKTGAGATPAADADAGG